MTEPGQSTYAGAGVQVEKAERFVDRLKALSRRPGHDSLWKGAGGYAAVWPLSPDRAVAVTTDGVGTKLLVATELNRLDTIGIDLVAMCANDLLCVGARPAVFLDYFAVGKLDDEHADAIMAGIVAGCDQAGMILAGGETAEMPGLYGPSHFDLAGFALGEVTLGRLITGERIAPGQKLIAVSSTGIHSNGLSLARRVLRKEDWRWLLEPTAIYAQPVGELLDNFLENVTGMAHITGGGWRNLLRLSRSVGFIVSDPPAVPEVFQRISDAGVAQDEMYRTFNMGMGFAVIVTGMVPQICELFERHGFTAGLVGEVSDEAGVVRLDGCDFVLKERGTEPSLKR